MQQFQVPQYIDLEPKILGPLTLVQSVVVVGAGAFIFILRFLLEIYLFVPIAIGIAIGALALGFIKINGRPLGGFMTSVVAHFISPRLYVWSKKEGEEKTPAKKGPAAEAGGIPPLVSPSSKITRERIRTLAQQLDSTGPEP